VTEQKESKRPLLVAYVEDTSREGNRRVNVFMYHGGTDIVIQMNRLSDFIRLFFHEKEVHTALEDVLVKKYIFAQMAWTNEGWAVLNIHEGPYHIKDICQKLFSYLREAGFDPLISDDWKRVEGKHQD